MTTIYLIRHAEAEGNLYRRVQGHYDGAVTERGREQIRALAGRFKGVKLDAVYSSDLKRASETAAALCGGLFAPRHVRLKELREMNMGEWEDRPWGDIEYSQPEQLRLFSFDPDKWQVDGGEPYWRLTGRMTEAISRLARAHGGETIAIVSHGMAIRAFLCDCLGLASERVGEVLHCDNTAVATLEFKDGVFNILSRGDNSHLTEETSTFAKQDWWKRSGGTDGKNLRFEPLDLEKELDLYVRCYVDAWRAAHGCMDGFNQDFHIRYAREHCSEHPLSLMKAFSAQNFAGLIELSVLRAKNEGAGWISLLYLQPEMRGMGFGAQLLGHAVSVYRAQGRKSLRLHVACENKSANAFYKKHGFKRKSLEKGAVDIMYLMQKPL